MIPSAVPPDTPTPPAPSSGRRMDIALRPPGFQADRLRMLGFAFLAGALFNGAFSFLASLLYVLTSQRPMFDATAPTFGTIFIEFFRSSYPSFFLAAAVVAAGHYLVQANAERSRDQSRALVRALRQGTRSKLPRPENDGENITP